MGAIAREKKKGSGEWWVFVSHKGQRKSKKIGPKRIAERQAAYGFILLTVPSFPSLSLLQGLRLFYPLRFDIAKARTRLMVSNIKIGYICLNTACNF